MKHTRLETTVEKIKEACASVMPIALITLFLSFTICPLPNDIFLAFVIGTCLLIIGLGLFELGAELSMSRIGGHIGVNLTKSKKIAVIAIISLIVGVLITISEPDLHVLSGYTGEQKFIFILAVAIGLGISLVCAVLRIIFNVKMRYVLLCGYGAVLLLTVIAYIVDPTFLAIAYDSGGVTTGAMSVPFVMSIGAGIAAIASEKSDDDNSFGLMAICSIGPIIAILLMGLMGGFEDISYTPSEIPSFDNSKEMGISFISKIPHVIKDVLMGLLPILAFFLIYQFFTARVGKKDMMQIFIGAGYTFVGMVLFLVGANVGFMPIGSYLGETFGGMDNKWIIVPIGMLIGFCMTYAEPAVSVQEKQVEEATSGLIPRKILPLMMGIGVAISSGIAMIRALTGISILPFLIVGYIIAIALTFYCPGIFTSIAFDAGGVASGVMAATFMLPLSIGLCNSRGANSTEIMIDAFGTIALVAMTPTISIQILGIIFKHKQDKSAAEIIDDAEIINLTALDGIDSASDYDTEIIEFDFVASYKEKE